MATYVIGDLHGCYHELLDLLSEFNFDKGSDILWFAGDLVNRGPCSLETIHIVKDLGAITVLGNHDLHLITIAHELMPIKPFDTVDAILQAPEREELINWLLNQPLLHEDKDLGYVLVHAGLHPRWSIDSARQYAKEVESVLRSESYLDFFNNMRGDKPDSWSNDLQGWDRLRVITNIFTRMRYCDEEGKLPIAEKGPPGTKNCPYLPWYKITSRKNADYKILFGHWACLDYGDEKDFETYGVFPLDTGCVWGRKLTAMRLEDGKYFSVPSRQKKYKAK